MQYLSYDEYTDLGGALPKADFSRYSFRAEREIDSRTQSRLHKVSDIPDAVKRCMFELVDYLSVHSKAGEMVKITGESNDGFSVSYGTDNSKSPENEIYDLIYTYLAETDLMFCGVIT